MLWKRLFTMVVVVEVCMVFRCVTKVSRFPLGYNQQFYGVTRPLCTEIIQKFTIRFALTVWRYLECLLWYVGTLKLVYWCITTLRKRNYISDYWCCPEWMKEEEQQQHYWLCYILGILTLLVLCLVHEKEWKNDIFVEMLFLKGWTIEAGRRRFHLVFNLVMLSMLYCRIWWI